MNKKQLIFSLFIFLTCTNLSLACDNIEEKSDLDQRLALLLQRTLVLDMPSCGLDDEAACKIAKGIKNSSATQVNFNHNNIGNKGIKALGEVFETLPLTHVNLYGNSFNDVGAIHLFSSLKKIPSLVFIDLRATLIGEESLPSLAELLQGNPKIQIHFNYGNLKHMFK